MIIELDIPEKLTRKLRALSALTGTTAGLEDMLVNYMDETVSQKIIDCLEPQEAFTPTKPRPKFDDLADGLGDEDESEPPPVDDMYDLVPKGTLSDEALAEDMEVGDPDHEAKAEAPADNGQHYGYAEEMFSKMVGLPVFDPDDKEIDPRILNRKKKLVIKGRVSPATSIQESF